MASTLVRRQSSLLRAQTVQDGGMIPRLNRLPSLKPTNMVPLPSPVFWEVGAANDVEANIPPPPFRNRLAGASYMFLGVDFRVWLPNCAFTHSLIHENAMVVPLALLAFLLGAPLILFPVLVCLKADGIIAASWCACFIPLWIVHAIDNIYCPWLAHHNKAASETIPTSTPSALSPRQDPNSPGHPLVLSPSSPMPTSPAQSSDDMQASTTAYSVQATAGNSSHPPSPQAPAAAALIDTAASQPDPATSAGATTFNWRDIAMTTCVVAAEGMVALRLDGHLVSVPWSVLFGCPLVIYHAFHWQDTSFTPWFRDCLFHVAQVVFVALKLDGVLVDWSWAIVFLPTWIAAAIVVSILTRDAWVALFRPTEPSTPMNLAGQVLLVVAAVWYFLPYVLLVAALDGAVAFPSSVVVLVPWLVAVGGWVLVVLAAAWEDDGIGSPEVQAINHLEYTAWYIVVPWSVTNVWMLLLMVVALVCMESDGTTTEVAPVETEDVPTTSPDPPRSH